MALLKVLIPAQQALATAFDDSWLGRVDGATLDSDGPVSKPLSTFDFDQTKVEQLSCIIATNMGTQYVLCWRVVSVCSASGHVVPASVVVAKCRPQQASTGPRVVSTQARIRSHPKRTRYEIL